MDALLVEGGAYRLLCDFSVWQLVVVGCCGIFFGWLWALVGRCGIFVGGSR